MHGCSYINLDRCIATQDQPENYIFIIGAIGKWHLAFGCLKLLISLHFEHLAPSPGHYGWLGWGFYIAVYGVDKA